MSCINVQSPQSTPPLMNWGFSETQGKGSTIFDSGLFGAKAGQTLIASFAVNSVVAVTSGLVILTYGVTLAGLMILKSSAIICGVSIVLFSIRKCLEYYVSFQNAGIIDISEANHMKIWKDNTPYEAEMLPTKHCADTQKWRERLISVAEHNIVLSGNYCGGVVFDEVLDLIKERMREKPNLKVVILSHPKFIKNENKYELDHCGNRLRLQIQNRKKITEMKKQFPERFSLVDCPDVWMFGSSIKKVTNHTKYLGIDYGKYYILGGSAVKDNFNLSGASNPMELLQLEEGKHLKSELSKVVDRLETFKQYSQAILKKIEKLDTEVTSTSFDPKVIESMVAKNRETLRLSLKILDQIKKHSETTKDLKLVEKTLSRITLSIHSFNQALLLFNRIIKHSLTGNDYSDLLKEFNAKVKLCMKKLNSQKLSKNFITNGEQVSITQNTKMVQDFFEEITNLNGNIRKFCTSCSGSSIDAGIEGLFVPGNFRDMDFVFCDKKGETSPGRRLYLQMVSLAYRWEQYNSAQAKDTSIPQYEGTDVPRFQAFIPKEYTGVDPILVKKEDSLVIKLMKETMPDYEEVNSVVDAFHKNPSIDKKGKMQLFFSGPEQLDQTSDFRRELLNQINSAKDEVVINHMYFHPTDDVKQALIQALKRGVKVQIITCERHPTAPNSHAVFGPRNKYNYASLFKAVPENLRKNFEVYHFTQHKIGLHKKVIIFDRKRVLAGSSNLGYKSLQTSSDHEVNFLAHSKKLAEESYKICELDIMLSKEVRNPGYLEYQDYFAAASHRLMAPLIG